MAKGGKTAWYKRIQSRTDFTIGTGDQKRLHLRPAVAGLDLVHKTTPSSPETKKPAFYIRSPQEGYLSLVERSACFVQGIAREAMEEQSAIGSGLV